MEMYTYTLPSGAKLVGYLRDETTETITLRSIDTNMALPFVGDIDALF